MEVMTAFELEFELFIERRLKVVTMCLTCATWSMSGSFCLARPQFELTIELVQVMALVTDKIHASPSYLAGIPPGRSRNIMTTMSVLVSASDSIVMAFCRSA